MKKIIASALLLTSTFAHAADFSILINKQSSQNYKTCPNLSFSATFRELLGSNTLVLTRLNNEAYNIFAKQTVNQGYHFNINKNLASNLTLQNIYLQCTTFKCDQKIAYASVLNTDAPPFAMTCTYTN